MGQIELTADDNLDGWFGLFPTGSGNLTLSLNEDPIIYLDRRGDCLLYPSWDKPAAIKRQKSLKFFNIMFKPHGLHLISGIPLGEFRGNSLEADCVFSPLELSRVKDRLLNCKNPDHRFALMEQFLNGKFRHDLLDTRVDFAIKAYHQVDWDPVTMSDRVCLSPRRFRELFSNQTGFSPAYYKKLIRFNKSSKQINGTSLTEVALSNGYYDQSHFIKDFKHFSGLTPSTYLQLKLNSADFYNYDFEDLNIFAIK
jgi:AraC-like DNA-binding protein